jgi:hypothetical protein
LKKQINTYFKEMGSQVHPQKSRVILWDPSPFRPNWAITQPASVPFQYLGIPFSTETTDTALFSTTIRRRTTKLLSWSRFHLSLIGRVLVANTSVDSHLWYVLAMADIPPEVLAKLEASRWEYIFPSKGKNRVAYNKIYKPKEAGGLGLKNLLLQTQALHARWILLALHGNGLFSTILLPFFTAEAQACGLDLLAPHGASVAAISILSRRQGLFARAATAWFSLGWTSHTCINDGRSTTAPIAQATVKSLYFSLMATLYDKKAKLVTFKARPFLTSEPADFTLNPDWRKCCKAWLQPKLNTFRFLAWHGKGIAGDEPWSHSHCAFCGQHFGRRHILLRCSFTHFLVERLQQKIGQIEPEHWHSLGGARNRRDTLLITELAWQIWTTYTHLRSEHTESTDLWHADHALTDSIWTHFRSQAHKSFKALVLTEQIKAAQKDFSKQRSNRWKQRLFFWKRQLSLITWISD